ncbi:hypothetical protein [Bdellovibrio sp. HCB2-146]|uniref:hypothetical protein n=1 Tax=Bdellovibrio sp. HCB2-146 TaxID=3394362 RepID=UPI0039BC4CE0
MEKISGILPPSPRMKLMEVASAQPVRPGAPEFGRPMGKNSIGERITLSKQLDEMRQTGQMPTPEVQVPATYKNTEANKIKVIEDINKKFFSSPSEIAEDKKELRGTEDSMAEQTLKKTTSNESAFSVSDRPAYRAETRDSLEK